MHSSGLPENSTTPSVQWRGIYFTAVSERDEQKSPIRLRLAAKVIEDRIVELGSGIVAPQELEDLGSALVYVRLLLIVYSPIRQSSLIERRTQNGDPDRPIKHLYPANRVSA